jgi:hypothetical protein
MPTFHSLTTYLRDVLMFHRLDVVPYSKSINTVSPQLQVSVYPQAESGSLDQKIVIVLAHVE